MKTKWSFKKKLLKQLLDSAELALDATPDCKVLQGIVKQRRIKFEQEK